MVRLILSQILEILGVIAIIAGVAVISWPAAVVVAGVFALIIGVLLDPPWVPRPPKPHPKEVDD